MGSKMKKSKKKKKEEEKRDVMEAEGGRDGGKQRHGSNIITDSRFASVHSDPRFQEAPKHKAKVTIDSRFDRMFRDKRFAASSATVDKRGRIKKKDSSQNHLKHYYRLEEGGGKGDEDEPEFGEKVKSDDSEGVESGEESGSESESESEGEKLKKIGRDVDESESSVEVEPSESDDEEAEVKDGESDESSTTDSDDEEIYSEGEDTFFQEENVPDIDQETHRLAIVNMDWNQVKAVDLYMVLSSFLPKGGRILSVSVYPSEFGLKRMEEEAVHGPVALFDDDKEKSKKDEDDDDDEDEIDNEKLRAYELSRLRYYYAVVECDSSATADYLYKSCDGVEFERSSNKLDLRFIPDSMEFKHPPRDVATEAPTNYQGLDYHSKALQHSKIQLSWDEDEPQRAMTLKRKFNAEQLAELELKEFLASDGSESDDDDDGNDYADAKAGKKHKKQDKYRALIRPGNGSEDDEEDGGEDMEVTFNTGLEDISKRILEKKDKKAETVWEAYLRQRKEKKKARKQRHANSSDDDTSDSEREPAEVPDDFFIEEPSVVNKNIQGKGSKKRKKEKETVDEAEASRAELELLLADDKGTDTNIKGYNLKRKKAEGKGKKEITDEGKIPVVDYHDPRFSALFTSPLFALDPTDPNFKRSAAYARQIAQKQPKGNVESIGQEAHADLHGRTKLTDDLGTDINEPLQSDTLSSRKDKHEL